MFVTTYRYWNLLNLTHTLSDRPVLPDRIPKLELPPGRYEFEEGGNPYPKGDSNFLFLPGTKIGVARSYWERQAGKEHGLARVIIEE